jgi:5-methylcytosine-specific restriction endonuclease McrA
MPIKKENRKRYPKNWKWIREAILNRAGHCCERCGVPNRAYGWREKDGTFTLVFDPFMQDPKNPFYRGKPIRIILTIAHLDHIPEHNHPDNLKALCQKCHLAYDRGSGGTRPRPDDFKEAHFATVAQPSAR